MLSLYLCFIGNIDSYGTLLLYMFMPLQHTCVVVFYKGLIIVYFSLCVINGHFDWLHIDGKVRYNQTKYTGESEEKNISVTMFMLQENAL